MITREKEISLCGSVDLLAAIFCEERDKLRKKYGLPLTSAPCLNCSKPIRLLPNHQNLFCSRKCRDAYAHIKVECDECGTIFERFQSVLIYQINKRNQQHLFCSRKCLGNFVGRNYGFKAHPENIRYIRSSILQRMIGGNCEYTS